MDEFIIEVVCVILFAARSYVAIVVEITLLDPVNCREEAIAADVELTLPN